MSKHQDYQNTSGFNFMAWAAFGISTVATLAGIFYLDGLIWAKAFLCVSYLFSITACFTVAKVIRDKAESEKLANRIEKAKTDKILKEYEP